jgi:hypothetical protein
MTERLELDRIGGKVGIRSTLRTPETQVDRLLAAARVCLKNGYGKAADILIAAAADLRKQTPES